MFVLPLLLVVEVIPIDQGADAPEHSSVFPTIVAVVSAGDQ